MKIVYLLTALFVSGIGSAENYNSLNLSSDIIASYKYCVKSNTGTNRINNCSFILLDSIRELDGSKDGMIMETLKITVEAIDLQ